ncbi:dnaJ homolog subfamily C member 24 [Copidosoma floridanum]|uniref:dnaJ homolog subfamily C member 24 n=1 Tax=Copidosoma floridanum TaxID=29053 RepID=UPI0006C95341|nr:dnaJ homolog subfamily C member 24 [Copidosoma floridanum]
MSRNSNIIDQDHYQVLGCTSESSFEELKEAYRRKVLESHPDKSSNAKETVGTFREVKTAWETLKDPELRKKYDLKYREACLEAETALVHARLTPLELEETEEQDILSYPCRCGNSYLVHKTELEEINCIVHVPCQDCTFVIAIET